MAIASWPVSLTAVSVLTSADVELSVTPASVSVVVDELHPARTTPNAICAARRARGLLGLWLGWAHSAASQKGQRASLART